MRPAVALPFVFLRRTFDPRIPGFPTRTLFSGFGVKYFLFICLVIELVVLEAASSGLVSLVFAFFDSVKLFVKSGTQ